jgi:NADH dehydrogenase FAD-containing subunit
LRRAPVDITLIDRRNFHLFQPLLYKVATGSLSPADISAPLPGISSHQKNARVLMGEAVDLGPHARRLILKRRRHFRLRLSAGRDRLQKLLLRQRPMEHFGANLKAIAP